VRAMKARTLRLFDEYAASHQHPTNRLTHKIAIPLIVFHVLAMLDWVRLVPVPGIPGGALTLGMVVYAATAVWYLRADLKLGLMVMALSALSFPIGRVLPWWSVVVLAVVAWGVQLAGHVVWEKKQPSFLTNMVHALVGPLFFVAVLAGAYRIGERRVRQTQAA
jgi:uncharacterized membrane protein YGL010W